MLIILQKNHLKNSKFHGFEVQKFLRYPNKIEDSLVAITKVKNKEQRKINSAKNSEELLEDFQFKFNQNKLKILKDIDNLYNSGFEICFLELVIMLHPLSQ